MKAFCGALLLGAMAGSVGWAGPINQGGVSAGSSAAASCAGSQFFGGGLGPGTFYCGNVPGPDQPYVNVGPTDVETFAQNSFSSASGPTGQGSFTNNSWASANQGVIHLYSTSNEQDGTPAVGTVADAGWNDTVTITGGTPGSQGIWNIQILVHGELIADGAYASMAELELAPYVNGNLLAQTQGFYLANDGYCHSFAGVPYTCQWYGAQVNSGPGYQVITFLAENNDDALGPYTAPTTVKDYTFNQLVTFQIPFTFGTAFELGIWADTLAGTKSYGAHPDNATANVGNTLTWNGSTVLPTGDGTGTPSSNFTATGLGGFDYNVAVTPEPGCFVLAALALGLGAALRRRRS
jgi:MYXO-CTERM domain-containing protein